MLAEDASGYQNLLRLVSLGYTEGFYSKPRIDIDALREHRDGIIGLTGCIAGFVPRELGRSKENAELNFATLVDVLVKIIYMPKL